MLTTFKKMGAALAAAFFFWSFSSLALAADIMPVGDVRPGMQGIAKTVVAGTDIEEFGVEVIGVLKDKGPSGDLILVRTYGDVIDRTGGIVQGMSGSPVYIDGKLVGAIAYGWSLTDHRVGMLTPIGDMLKLWEPAPEKKTNPSTTEEKKNKQLAGAAGQASEEQALAMSGSLRPLDTPLMVAGFTPQALKWLGEKVKPLNLVPFAVGASPESAVYGSLQPGSALAAELVRGDVSVGAIGTVTYVEDGKILAFGHPFLRRGGSSYFLSQAYIFTTVPSLESGFKLGSAGPMVGKIAQDRGAGIAGEVGAYPNIVPVRVHVMDKDLQRQQDAGLQVVQDEKLTPLLATAAVYNVVDKTLDRQGAGTAKVRFEISAPGVPGDVVVRENMFYSPANIGETAMGELFEGLNLLAGNSFQALTLFDVNVQIEVEEERKTAVITQAKAVQASVKPGEKAQIQITLKPYRGENIIRTVNYEVPKTQPEGNLSLLVRGGGSIPIAKLMEGQGNLLLELLQKKRTRTLEEEVKHFTESDRNNDIVVEPAPLEEEMAKQGPGAMQAKKIQNKAAKAEEPIVEKKENKPQGKNGLLGAKDKKDDKGKSKTMTDYIIDGDTMVTLQVKK